jgi:hypothetical protein
MPTIEFTTQEIEFLRFKYEKELEEGLRHVEYLRSILSKIRPARRELQPGEVKRGPGRPRKIRPEGMIRQPRELLPGEVRRGPGRPKKIRPEGMIQQPGGSVTGEVKRGPGRPKKIMTGNMIIKVPKQLKPGEEKRGPGRPKKIQVETVAQEIVIPEVKPTKPIVAKTVSKKKTAKKRSVIIRKKPSEIVPETKPTDLTEPVAIIETPVIPEPETIQEVEKSE